jgi:hypothetical protein
MKRLVISGLLSLAAVSCGSSKTTAEDVKKHFCGGATAADFATAKSCYGTAWTKLATTTVTITAEVCNNAAAAKAAALIADTTNDTDAKKSDALKKLIDESKFGTTETENKTVCAKITIS